MERFVFGVSGLPSLVAQKTRYTHRSRGLGMRSFRVLYPTRVLDSLHRNPLLATIEEVGWRQPPSFPWHAKPQSHEIQDFPFSFLLIFHQFRFLGRNL